jgi:Helix-turn-helix domain
LQADLSPRAGIGPVLRRARESRGVSLDAASRSTRIRPRYLAALEDDAGVDAFPGPVYARFFLREYARYLGVEDEPLVTALEQRTAPAPPPLRLVGELQPPRRWVGRLVRVAAVLMLLGLVGYTIVQSGGRPGSAAETGRDRLTQAPGYTHRSNSSVGRPRPKVPIRTVVDVVAPTHALILVDGERVVNRVLQPHRFVFDVPRKGSGDPRIELTIDDGSAVRLAVNGRSVPTAGHAQFHATFVSSFGRAVRL